MSSDVGIYGLPPQGIQLALSLATKGYTVSIGNKSSDKISECMELAEREKIDSKLNGIKEPNEFVLSLRIPRKIIIVGKAGSSLEKTYKKILNLMEPGDILVDASQEWYEDQIRRDKEVAEKNCLYLSLGISTNDLNMRTAPCLLISGNREGFVAMEPILVKCAAEVHYKPCFSYLGKGAAGQYVRMLADFLFCADMQGIAEAYGLLRDLGFSVDDIVEAFQTLNKDVLAGYLLSTVIEILKKKDQDVVGISKSDNLLLSRISDISDDKAATFVLREGSEFSVALPSVDAAVSEVFISQLRDARRILAKTIKPPKFDVAGMDNAQIVDDLRAALVCSRVVTYTQCMQLLQAASERYEWDVQFKDVAKMLHGASVVRCELWDRFMEAFEKNPKLDLALFDDVLAALLNTNQLGWRRLVSLSITSGIALPVISASLTYVDTLRRKTLPTVVAAASKDYLAGVSFERVDQELGKRYHCRWTKKFT